MMLIAHDTLRFDGFRSIFEKKNRPVVYSNIEYFFNILEHFGVFSNMFEWDHVRFHENSIEMVEVENSDIPGERTAGFQKQFLIPEPFHDIYVDIRSDFNHLSEDNKEFVDKKIRHAKSGTFLPPSLNHDVLMYGINGGANLSGGAIDFSDKNPSVIIPFNKQACYYSLGS